jgi:hypothetical protein
MSRRVARPARTCGRGADLTWIESLEGRQLLSIVSIDVQLNNLAEPQVASTVTAMLAAEPVRALGQANHTIYVLYSSTGADLDTASLGNDDITVTAADDTELAVTFQAVTQVTPTQWTASYVVAAPGGTWDAADAGLYTVTVNGGAVEDVEDVGIEEEEIDTFKAWRIQAVTAQGATYPDQGATVSVSLKGPGAAELRFLDDGAIQPDMLWSDNTTMASSITVKVTGGSGKTLIHDLQINGDLKAFSAPTMSFDGNMFIEGFAKTITLGDITSLGTLTVETQVGELETSITLGRVEGLTLTSFVPIKSLRAVNWLRGEGAQINGTTIKSLQITGNGEGDTFSADMNLGGGDAIQTLGSAKFAGEIDNSEWSISGDIGSITVARPASDWVVADATSLGSLNALDLLDVEIVLQGSIGSIKAREWVDGTLTASTLKTLAVAQDADFFMHLIGQAMIMDDEGPAPVILTKATIGDLSGTWVVLGSAGTITVADQIADFNADVHGNVKSIRGGVGSHANFFVEDTLTSLTMGSWDFGDIMADAVGSITIAGDCADMLLRLDNSQVATSLGKFTVGGWVENIWLSADSNVGAITVGGISGSLISVGVTQNLFADDIDDFDFEPTLGNFTVRGLTRGDNPQSQIDTVVNAWRIGTLSLRNVQRDNDEVPHGIAATAIGSFRLVQPDNSVYTDPDDLPNPLDFQVRLLNVPG